MQKGWGGRLAMLRGCLAMASLVALAVASAKAQPSPEDRPSVLMLIGNRSTAPGMVQLDATFRQAVSAGLAGEIDYHVEYLDLSEGGASPYADQVEALLHAKYSGHVPKLVAVASSPALAFLIERRARLFPGVPILYVAVSRETVARLPLPADSTGFTIDLDHQRTVEIALTVQPDARRLVIVAGAAPSDRATAALAERLAHAHSSSVEVVSLVGQPLEEQVRRVAALPRDSVAVFTSYRADSAGRSMVAAEVVPVIARAASVPTFGAFELWLGYGIVGGDLLSYETMGRRAGQVAARILKGEPAGSIPPVNDAWSTLAFDWRELRRWNIDPRRLPAGSQVRFREVSFWERYRREALGVLVALVGQALLIGFLLAERRSRRRTQAELADAERRYRTVADFTADWEYWVRPDGTFAYMSPSCQSFTGYPASEFADNPSLLNDIVVADDRPLWQAHQREVVAAPGPAQLEFRISTRAGEVRWIDHVCAPVRGEDGSDLGVRGSNRDITPRKQAEEDLRHAFAEIAQLRDRLEVDNSYLREQLAPAAGEHGILGTSDAMRYVLSKVHQVAPTETTVLLLGETGVGKSLIAQTIHNLSPRQRRPLVTLNCAALPATLVESELFGHEKGAFTGAHAMRRGRFEIADGSTLFLDEIGDLPLDLQGKLLRAIHDGEFERVGGNVTLKTDVRLVAATNRRLDEDVRSGRFRQDLWYRLSVFPITVPPLRQRREDIPMLVAHFVDKHCRKLGRPVLQVSKASMKALQSRDWPGNIRELENVVERVAISSRGEMFDLGDEPASRPSGSRPDADVRDDRTLEEIERDHIVRTLDRVKWRVTGRGGAAEALAINPSTLRSRMRKLGIERPDRNGPAPVPS